MADRTFWIGQIEEAFRSRSVLWLSGVRRAGKTMLAQSLPGAEYLDCELPRVRRGIEDDPQAFLESMGSRTVVLDEIHRLANPSEVLKIAADHFPKTRVLATGSSTLGASAKFRDTLAGRKRELWLTPMISADLADFGRVDLGRRLHHGGLPPMFLAEKFPERDIAEWFDAYWAKDIQALFRLERRTAFLRLAELLMVQSGGIFEASKFARPCEVSRSTVSNYLAVLEATFLVHVVRPFSSQSAAEIVAAPKVYAFDTGFVCAMRGWDRLRPDDMGTLWEHYVLNEIVARTQSRRVLYWRDKQGHEVDFVLARRGGAPAALECKRSSKDFDATGLRSFRGRYPDGDNLVVCSDVTRAFTRTFGDVSVRFVGLLGLVEWLAGRR
ncbi:MAG: DUF4143 domain-containing protein [Planctomycetes bacterium]|nr:DUF4143 domain-containing protein [Planctomycetota bacterium]